MTQCSRGSYKTNTECERAQLRVLHGGGWLQRLIEKRATAAVAAVFLVASSLEFGQFFWWLLVWNPVLSGLSWGQSAWQWRRESGSSLPPTPDPCRDSTSSFKMQPGNGIQLPKTSPSHSSWIVQAFSLKRWFSGRAWQCLELWVRPHFVFEMDAQLVPLEKGATYLCLNLPRAIYYWLIDWLVVSGNPVYWELAGLPAAGREGAQSGSPYHGRTLHSFSMKTQRDTVIEAAAFFKVFDMCS